ncbi:hypothetical protein KC19_4G037000 [Ceratodon purpureus]|uniref:Uncharacterized protein n=1 Tax=Ceratodon purpureus TaxID=3225 RepID=A0A8T0I677_CERPU|nr:hypothetical protein KC19_4G037000 [Ceratodon purpureus]
MPTSWRFNVWRRRPTSQQPESSQYQQIILTHKYVVALFAFLVSVDLIEIVGVLCYQLFTASYFPWHLYPMMLNRAVELVAFICSRGYIPSLYSIAQISLSLLSISVYAKQQPCKKYSCAAPLVLYCILLSYQIFVAVMVVKVSRMPMADDEGHIIANWPTTQVSPVANVEDPHLRPLGIQIIGLSPRAMRARVINQVIPHERRSTQIASSANNKPMLTDPTEVIYAVQQPDGEKMQLAIARICKDMTLDSSQPIGTSSSSTSANPQVHSLASLLSRPLSPPLSDSAINVPQLQSSLIEELEEIEIHEQSPNPLPPT